MRAAALIDLNRDAEAQADVDAVLSTMPRHPLASYLGALIPEVAGGLPKNGPEGDAQIEERVRGKVSELCDAFPVYPGM